MVTVFLMQMLAGTVPTVPKPENAMPAVIIDIGHSGTKTGQVIRILKNGYWFYLVERDANCDISARVLDGLDTARVPALFTTSAECAMEISHGDLLVSEDIPKVEIFPLRDETDRHYIVSGSEEGLRARLDIPRMIARTAANPPLVVSIHLDYAPSDTLKGVYAMVPTGHQSSRFARNLVQELGKVGGLRIHCPARASIIDHGNCLPDVRILKEGGDLNIVLLELLNLRNKEERTCVQSAYCRQKYADAIVTGILKTLRYSLRAEN